MKEKNIYKMALVLLCLLAVAYINGGYAQLYEMFSNWIR